LKVWSPTVGEFGGYSGNFRRGSTGNVMHSGSVLKCLLFALMFSLLPGYHDVSCSVPLSPLHHDRLKPLKLLAKINISSLNMFSQVLSQQ
jgi:hypothetical protein